MYIKYSKGLSLSLSLCHILFFPASIFISLFYYWLFIQQMIIFNDGWHVAARYGWWMMNDGVIVKVKVRYNDTARIYFTNHMGCQSRMWLLLNSFSQKLLWNYYTLIVVLWEVKSNTHFFEGMCCRLERAYLHCYSRYVTAVIVSVTTAVTAQMPPESTGIKMLYLNLESCRPEGGRLLAPK